MLTPNLCSTVPYMRAQLTCSICGHRSPSQPNSNELVMLSAQQNALEPMCISQPFFNQKKISDLLTTIREEQGKMSLSMQVLNS
eukprot:1607521-Amphidinium_carterae.1